VFELTTCVQQLESHFDVSHGRIVEHNLCDFRALANILDYLGSRDGFPTVSTHSTTQRVGLQYRNTADAV
jgi:hypothetical protein